MAREALEIMAEETFREANRNVPVTHGALASGARVVRRANGEPYVTSGPPRPDEEILLRRADGRPVRPPAASRFLSIQSPSRVMRPVPELARECGHEWQEVDLVVTGEVVAWYCRRCERQEYAEGW